MRYHDTMAQTTHIVMLNHHSGELIDYLKQGLGNLSVEFHLPETGSPEQQRQSLLDLAQQAHILIGWGSDLELLERAKDLKLFINPGTGITHHLDTFRELKKSGSDVVLANGHGNSYAVAQHTVALLLALTNKVIPHHRKMADYLKAENPQRSVYMKNQTVGLLSYGAINSKVHRFLSGFDVQFAACRRSWDDDENYPTPIEKFDNSQLLEFFVHCDIVINALPHTRYTHDLVNMAAFERLGEHGLFVNVGRGATVVQADMYHALKNRVIAGAALEVWWRRGPKPDDPDVRHDPYEQAHPFHELDNVVMSPHRGADSGGNLDRWDEVIENIKRVHAGRSDYLNIVNLDLEY